MFGLGPLISLAIYAGIAAVALGAVYGFDKSRQNVGREKQIAEDQPVMSVCEQFPSKGLFGGAKASDPADCAVSLRAAIDKGKAAEAANVSLQADLANLETQRKACSTAVARIERQVGATKALIDARKPDDDRLLALVSNDRERLQRELQNFGTKVRTCEQELAERNAAWNATAKQRQRDFPQTGAPPQSGDVNLRPTNPLTK